MRLLPSLIAGSTIGAFFQAPIGSAHSDPIYQNEYCPSSLTAEQQIQFFRRVMNIGASYSHGCSECDVVPQFRKGGEKTGDLGWARRNFLVHFLNHGPWKSPENFAHEFIAVAENDPATNFSMLFEPLFLRFSPYRGRWIYQPQRDTLTVMTRQDISRLSKDPAFEDDGPSVDGPPVRRSHKRVPSQRYGVVYQTFPGKFAAGGAKTKTIIDLAMDGQRAHEFLRRMGGIATYEQLMATGWQSPHLRQLLIQNVLGELSKWQPTSVFAVDALFWDAVPHMLEIVHQQRPKSLVNKIITHRMSQQFLDLQYFGSDVERRIRLDFLEVLARFSNIQSADAPVPVMLATLIDGPGRHIVTNGLQANFAQLIGTFVNHLTGIDISQELLTWLNKIAYDPASPVALTPQKYYDPVTGETLSPEQRLHYRKILQNIESQWHAHSALNASTPLGNGASVPKPLKGLLTTIILDALQDLESYIRAADTAFATVNSDIRTFALRQDHNVKIINVDPFFKNFHRLVHPETMHPTVAAARWMANLVDSSLCGRAVHPPP